MDNEQDPSRDSLALARKHVRALTDGGVSREALLRALLEQEEAGNQLPPLPSQAAPQPQLKKSKSLSKSLSRTQSLSQHKSQSHWSVSTTGRTRAEGDRPPSSDQLSISTGNSGSGSRGSYLSTHTTSTSLSSRDSTITQFPGSEIPGARPNSASTRAYWCTSCDTEFKRKFDWKRHEDEFHERYKKYPCPDCNRVFWGANTFNQHHKTRHNCKTCPHADKVIKYTRKKRAWACGFCAAFLPSMDRYIDHIGLHYESGRTRAHWYHSNVIYGLLHQPGVNAAWKDIIGSRFSHIPKGEQPRYGWDAKTTGRKQGFLENETAGNLQDLLEFFNPTKDDPAKVARLAFDFAELTPANQALSRGSLDVPDKPPMPAPKREVSSTSSSRKPKPGSPPKALALAPPPTVKERPLTQWPGFLPTDAPDMPPPKTVPGNDNDVQMPDYDDVALPQPLFAGPLSPPPSYNHHQPPPSLAITPSSDQPTYLTPTTPLPQTPLTPFPNAGPGMARDTVVDLLSEYMDGGDMHGPLPDMCMPQDATMCRQQQQQHPPPPPPFGHFEDWNSICSTMVDDIASPRHNGPPLPLAPHEQQQQQQQQQQSQPRQQVRRSDFWAPGRVVGGGGGGGGETDSLYLEDVRACDLADFPPPPGIRGEDVGRRSDIWASSGGGAVDYEGGGYEDEIAAPPPHANWL